MNKEYTFFNVEISIEASSVEEAYSKLCNLLNDDTAEFTTDTYKECKTFGEDDIRSTTELFPKD